MFDPPVAQSVKNPQDETQLLSCWRGFKKAKLESKDSPTTVAPRYSQQSASSHSWQKPGTSERPRASIALRRDPQVRLTTDQPSAKKRRTDVSQITDMFESIFRQCAAGDTVEPEVVQLFHDMLQNYPERERQSFYQQCGLLFSNPNSYRPY